MGGCQISEKVRNRVRRSDYVGLQGFQHGVYIFFSVNIQLDRFGKIQAEYAHDGLRIDNVPAGYKIKVIVKLCDIVHKRLYLVDGV